MSFLSRADSLRSLAQFPGSSINQNDLSRLRPNSQLSRLERRVVKIICETPNYTRFGSGVIVSTCGKILTAQHVISPLPQQSWRDAYALVSLMTDRGLEQTKLGFRLIRQCGKRDLALLQLLGRYHFTPMRMDDVLVREDDAVYAIGYPDGRKRVDSGHAISAIDPASENQRLKVLSFSRQCQPFRVNFLLDEILGYDGKGGGNIVSTNQCVGGSSGGALLNARGKLVGMVTGIKRHLEKVREDLTKMLGGDLSRRPALEHITISRPNRMLRAFLDNR